MWCGSLRLAHCRSKSKAFWSGLLFHKVDFVQLVKEFLNAGHEISSFLQGAILHYKINEPNKQTVNISTVLRDLPCPEDLASKDAHSSFGKIFGHCLQLTCWQDLVAVVQGYSLSTRLRGDPSSQLFPGSFLPSSAC